MIIDPQSFRDRPHERDLLHVDPHPPARDLPPVQPPPPMPADRALEAGAVVALIVAVAFASFVLALLFGGAP